MTCEHVCKISKWLVKRSSRTYRFSGVISLNLTFSVFRQLVPRKNTYVQTMARIFLLSYPRDSWAPKYQVFCWLTGRNRSVTRLQNYQVFCKKLTCLLLTSAHYLEFFLPVEVLRHGRVCDTELTDRLRIIMSSLFIDFIGIQKIKKSLIKENTFADWFKPYCLFDSI